MKRFLFNILRFSGIPFILRETIQRRKVTIITFHNPDINTFHICIKYLKKYYNIISLFHFIEFFNNLNSLPTKSVIITFDDGYKNNYSLLEIIKKYQIPVTIFVCSEIIDTNRHFWWTHINNQSDLKALKRMPENERISLYKKNSFGHLTDYGDDKRQTLNMQEISEMMDSGLVNFESHTMSHEILDMCDDDLSYKEIYLSKKNLEKKLKKNIIAIAYPNGVYTYRELRNVKGAGYKCALTTEPGYNNNKTELFKLKRLGIQDNSNINEIIVRSSGMWGFLKKIKKLIINEID